MQKMRFLLLRNCFTVDNYSLPEKTSSNIELRRNKREVKGERDEIALRWKPEVVAVESPSLPASHAAAFSIAPLLHNNLAACDAEHNSIIFLYCAACRKDGRWKMLRSTYSFRPEAGRTAKNVNKLIDKQASMLREVVKIAVASAAALIIKSIAFIRRLRHRLIRTAGAGFFQLQSEIAWGLCGNIREGSTKITSSGAKNKLHNLTSLLHASHQSTTKKGEAVNEKFLSISFHRVIMTSYSDWSCEELVLLAFFVLPLPLHVGRAPDD